MKPCYYLPVVTGLFNNTTSAAFCAEEMHRLDTQHLSAKAAAAQA